MSDSMVRPREMSDLELITSFLNGQLDPERDAQVRDRLDHDAAFKELAAPLLFVWQVPPDWKRHPRPAGEAERMWDEFTKKVGFVHQRRAARKRKLWMLVVALVVVGLGAFLLRGRLQDKYAEVRDFDLVSDTAGNFTLKDGTGVALAPNSSLRISKKPLQGDYYSVRLQGSARFLVQRPTTSGGTMTPRILFLMLPMGTLITSSADFSVNSHGDTADIEVFRRNRASQSTFMDATADFVLAASSGFRLRQVAIGEGEHGGVYTSAPAQRFAPATPTAPQPDVARSVVPPTAQPKDHRTLLPSSRASVARSPSDTGRWMTLSDSIRVFLQQGSEIRVDSAKGDDILKVRLTGSARFQLPAVKLGPNMAMPDRTLGILTRAAAVVTAAADFWVRARGDTTDVEVIDRHLQADFGIPVPLREQLLIFNPNPSRSGPQLQLHSGERARMIAGHAPVKLPADSSVSKPAGAKP